jgi:hypothetical protein
MKHNLFVIVCIGFFACTSSKKATNQPGQIEVSKIWDTAPHSAFPDIIRFKGAFYSSFREGTGHVPGTDGKARIIRSVDGNKWESVALLEKDGIDLRDPKLSVTPDNRLMVIIGGSVYDKEVRSKLLNLYPHVSFSDATGSNFSAPEKVSIQPANASGRDWIWRVTWHKGTGYAINYHDNTADLLSTKDGKKYEKVSSLNIDGYPNESTVRFDDNDNVHVLVRREEGDKMGILAKAAPPYSNWSYKKLSIRLGGPNFIFHKKNNIIIGSRLYAPEGAATAVFVTDLEGNVKKTINLPSKGDTSYPGLLVHNGELWVVYYSSHESKTSIYLAKIPLSELSV